MNPLEAVHILLDHFPEGTDALREALLKAVSAKTVKRLHCLLETPVYAGREKQREEEEALRTCLAASESQWEAYRTAVEAALGQTPKSDQRINHWRWIDLPNVLRELSALGIEVSVECIDCNKEDPELQLDRASREAMRKFRVACEVPMSQMNPQRRKAILDIFREHVIASGKSTVARDRLMQRQSDEAKSRLEKDENEGTLIAILTGANHLGVSRGRGARRVFALHTDEMRKELPIYSQLYCDGLEGQKSLKAGHGMELVDRDIEDAFLSHFFEGELASILRIEKASSHRDKRWQSIRPLASALINSLTNEDRSKLMDAIFSEKSESSRLFFAHAITIISRFLDERTGVRIQGEEDIPRFFEALHNICKAQLGKWQTLQQKEAQIDV